MAEAGRYLLKSSGPTPMLHRNAKTRFLRVLSGLVLSISQDRDSFGQPVPVFDDPHNKKKVFSYVQKSDPKWEATWNQINNDAKALGYKIF